MTSDRTGFLSFADVAVETTAERLPEIDRSAMAMVLLLYRVTSTVVYDLESRVHRPAGWSWSAFRLLFTLWVSGPTDSGRAAELAGMSRAAVSSLTKTLSASGLLSRTPNAQDRRGAVLALTGDGAAALRAAFVDHNAREAQWAGLLTDDERDTLTGLLRKIATSAQERDWVAQRS
jgi:DNA-binding MarR family transcriptional regulator